MNHFELRDGELWCEGVRLADVAAAVGTPVYVYSTATLERHYRAFADAFEGRALIAFAVKSNSNLSVLRTLAALGAGADTVSEGEIRRALAAGIPPERIVFSGVGKTDAELAFALDVGVAEINVESPPEMARLSAIAGAKGVRARLAIRVNPDVGAGGHDDIFVPPTKLPEVKDISSLRCVEMEDHHKGPGPTLQKHYERILRSLPVVSSRVQGPRGRGRGGGSAPVPAQQAPFGPQALASWGSDAPRTTCVP